MSAQKIFGIVLTVAGIALQAIPGIGQAIGLPMIAAGISSASVIGLGLVVAGSFLMGPSKPKGLRTQPTDRLTATLDPSAPRKIAFGNTALATDVRYQAFTGANQEYLEQIVCCASHKINSIYELWLDNEKTWDSTSGLASKFASFLTVDTRTEGTSANGIAIDSNWTVNSTLTGCAYIHLKFLLFHDDGQGGNDSPFASGVTSRMTIRGKGALVYDPRLDSTVAGGSGTQRATDQTTWAWNDSASRNPALQELWYELGWKINSKLAVGKGVPPARIDLASYAVAANACDESVALNGGGTEPRYRGDGILSEGDDPGSVRDNLCATMNAVLRDAGGKLSLTVLHNDLATPVTPSGKSAFDEDDIAGSIQWDQTPSLSQSFNIVRGRRVDPSDNALYQMADVPEVSLTSVDGIDRIDTFDLPLVQSNGQAQRLFKQRLERNQYQGRLTFTGKPSFWGVSLGNVFTLSHATFGWSGKLFRCAGQKINRFGATEIVAVEENSAIYAWDNSEAAPVTAGAPTVYNQTNDALQRGVNKSAKTGIVIDPISDVIINADSTGTVKSGELPRNVNITASIGTADVTTAGTWSRTTATGVTCTIGSATGILNITALSVTEVFVPVSLSLNGITRTANVHIVRQDDPPTNNGGTGGGGVSTTTLGATNGTAYDTVNSASATLTEAAGSAGQVALSAPLSFKRNTSAVNGSNGCFGKWQWRVIGGTFADVTTETSYSVASTTAAGNTTAGSISVSATKTGLTNGTSYEFRFLWRRADISGTAANVFRSSGAMTATGS